MNEFVLNELEKPDRTLLPLTSRKNGKTVYLFIAFGTSIHHFWQMMTIATNAYMALHPANVVTNTDTLERAKAGITKKLNDLRWSLQAELKVELPEFAFLEMDKEAARKITETIKLA